MNAIVPVTLLTGYLGSGKTTLINRLLADPQGRKIAVIVNDIGEINIDSTLIAAKGNVSVAEDSLVALTNGCICCTLRMDLVTQLVRLIQSRRFDYILIEASGLCEPQPIAQSVTMIEEGFNVIALITNEDKEVGRKKVLEPTPTDRKSVV